MQYSNFHKVGLKQLLCNWTIPGKIAPSPPRLKGILHPKFLILSSFTHPQVVGNLYEFLFSAEHKGRYFEERFEPKSCREKLIQVCSNLRVGKLQNFNFFGLSIPIISHLNLRSKMCFIHNCFMLYSNLLHSIYTKLDWNSVDIST